MAKDVHKINTKKMERITTENIILDDNAIIRELSALVPYPLSKSDKTIMNQLIDYVRSSQNEVEAKKRDLRPAYGISAVQVGKLRQLFYVRIENKYGNDAEEFALVNPKVIKASKQNAYLDQGEGCLSVAIDHKGYVLRPQRIIINAIDYFTEREVEIEAQGLTAIVLQHELDHLKGILYYDRINSLNPWALPDKKALKVK